MVSLPFVMMLALYHVNSYIATPAFVSFQSHHFETELRPNFFLHFSFCRVIVFSLPKPGKACKIRVNWEWFRRYIFEFSLLMLFLYKLLTRPKFWGIQYVEMMLMDSLSRMFIELPSFFLSTSRKKW